MNGWIFLRTINSLQRILVFNFIPLCIIGDSILLGLETVCEYLRLFIKFIKFVSYHADDS
jgi:hypothetical protein